MTSVKTGFHRARWASAALLLLVAGSALAVDGDAGGVTPGSGADPAVEARLRAELQAVMSGLIESGAIGASSTRDLHMNVETPARQVTDLGLLVDSARDARDGLHVLAVTPGSAAAKIGVRSGDVLVSVDGVALTGVDGAASVLRQGVDTAAGRGAIALEVRRNGQVQALRGALSSIYMPAMRLTIGTALATAATAASTEVASAPDGCGRINDFDVAPRQQGLHGAKVISIDGETPGPQGSHSFRVAAGRHVVKVSEQIEAKYLPFNDRLRNSGLAQTRYKTIDVDVAPGTTNLIAARLIPEQRTQWKDGAYWEPVAWKQISESCR